jgi:hypothetical protein
MTPSAPATTTAVCTATIILRAANTAGLLQLARCWTSAHTQQHKQPHLAISPQPPGLNTPGSHQHAHLPRVRPLKSACAQWRAGDKHSYGPGSQVTTKRGRGAGIGPALCPAATSHPPSHPHRQVLRTSLQKNTRNFPFPFGTIAEISWLSSS